MKRNDQVYARPEIPYRDTKANIEAFTGLVGGEVAYATDTGENGYYDAVAAEWVWGGGTPDGENHTHANLELAIWMRL